jgi:hypothetical protein
MRVLGIETSCDETGVALYDTTRELGFERRHHLADQRRTRCACASRGRQFGVDRRIDLGVRQRGRQIRLQDRDLGALGIGEIGTIAGVELRDRVLPLLHHLVDDGDDVRIRERF